eukprot:5047941-Pyramimonas_sp.AAC.1
MSHAILPHTRPARVPNNSDLHVVLDEQVLQEFGDAADSEHLAQVAPPGMTPRQALHTWRARGSANQVGPG